MLQLKEPYIIFLIGTPLVGKSTFISTKLPNLVDTSYRVISRDDIIMEHVIGDETYNDTYKRIDNKKYIDKILKERFSLSSLRKENVVIDMTNMTRKRRHNTASYFPKYNKYAIIFPFLTKEEYIARNNKRTKEQAKYISISNIHDMINQYVPIELDENFIETFNALDF